MFAFPHGGEFLAIATFSARWRNKSIEIATKKHFDANCQCLPPSVTATASDGTRYNFFFGKWLLLVVCVLNGYAGAKCSRNVTIFSIKFTLGSYEKLAQHSVKQTAARTKIQSPIDLCIVLHMPSVMSSMVSEWINCLENILCESTAAVERLQWWVSRENVVCAKQSILHTFHFVWHSLGLYENVCWIPSKRLHRESLVSLNESYLMN